jgi:hypothetical protein
MRVIAILTATALSAACGGSQPPAVPAASTTSATAAEPARGITAPADGDLHGAPRPDAEDLRELYDVSRDVLAAAADEAGAVEDLAQDIARFPAPDEPGPEARAMAEAIGRALKGRTVDEAGARRVAVLVYVAMHSGQLTPAQRTAAAAQLRETLAAMGAAPAQVDAVAGQIR